MLGVTDTAWVKSAARKDRWTDRQVTLQSLELCQLSIIRVSLLQWNVNGRQQYFWGQTQLLNWQKRSSQVATRIQNECPAWRRTTKAKAMFCGSLKDCEIALLASQSACKKYHLWHTPLKLGAACLTFSAHCDFKYGTLKKSTIN